MEKDRTPSLPAADDQSEAVVSLSDDPSNTLSGIRLAMLMVCGWLFYLAGVSDMSWYIVTLADDR